MAEIVSLWEGWGRKEEEGLRENKKELDYFQNFYFYTNSSTPTIGDCEYLNKVDTKLPALQKAEAN